MVYWLLPVSEAWELGKWLEATIQVGQFFELNQLRFRICDGHDYPANTANSGDASEVGMGSSRRGADGEDKIMPGTSGC